MNRNPLLAALVALAGLAAWWSVIHLLVEPR